MSAWAKVAIESAWCDLRYALRAIRRNRGFSGLVIVTLALGIGVNAASLAVGYGILVRAALTRLGLVVGFGLGSAAAKSGIASVPCQLL